MEKRFRLKAYSFQGMSKREFSTEGEARDFAAFMAQKYPRMLFEIHDEKRIGIERRTGERRSTHDRRSGVDRRTEDRRTGEDRRTPLAR